MDNNETRPLQDWRTSPNQQNNNQGFDQQNFGQQGYNQYPQYNQPQRQNQTQPYSQFQQYNQPQQYQPQYEQPKPSFDVPEEVANMRIPKLVWAFILFWPLAIPSLIFFIKAKSTASTDPNQAIYFSERFNFFSRLAIKIGIIIAAVCVLIYTIYFMVALIALANI